MNKQISVCVCPQVEALSDAVSVWRRGAGAAGRRRRCGRPEGGWLWQRGVAFFTPAPRRRLLGLPLCSYHGLSGHQDAAGLPGAGEHQHQEEAEDLRDQGESFTSKSNITAKKKLIIRVVFVLGKVSASDSDKAAFVFDLLEVTPRWRERQRAVRSPLALSIFIEAVQLYTKIKAERASVGFDPAAAAAGEQSWLQKGKESFF